MRNELMYFLAATNPNFTKHEYALRVASMKSYLADRVRFRRAVDHSCPACHEPFLTHVKKGLCPECRVARNRMAATAVSKIAVLIRQGKLHPASFYSCADCGNKADSYDHRDYLRPLMVTPVCRSCNSKRGYAEPFLTKLAAKHDLHHSSLYRAIGERK